MDDYFLWPTVGHAHKRASVGSHEAMFNRKLKGEIRELQHIPGFLGTVRGVSDVIWNNESPILWELQVRNLQHW